MSSHIWMEMPRELEEGASLRLSGHGDSECRDSEGKEIELHLGYGSIDWSDDMQRLKGSFRWIATVKFMRDYVYSSKLGIAREVEDGLWTGHRESSGVFVVTPRKGCKHKRSSRLVDPATVALLIKLLLGQPPFVGPMAVPWREAQETILAIAALLIRRLSVAVDLLSRTRRRRSCSRARPSYLTALAGMF